MSHNLQREALQNCTADDIMAIELACHHFPWSEKTLLSCLGGRYYNSGLFVEQKLVGFYIVEQAGSDHTLMEICIAPSHQGQGLAHILMQDFLARAEQMKAESCFLEVRESNQSAHALYLNYGFEDVGIRKNYYPSDNGKEHAILMSKAF